MGTFIFLIYLLVRFIVWDLQVKIRKVISFRWARNYLRPKTYIWSNHIFRMARFFTGLRFELGNQTGSKLPEAMIVVANHQSLLDIVAIMASVPTQQLRFVAKRSLGKWIPGVSELLRTQRHGLIDRSGSLRRSLKDLKALARRSASGLSPVVFPEGTRSRDGRLRRFHVGALRTLAEETDLPIVSVALDGGYRIASLADTRRGLSEIVYRVSFQRVYPNPTSKQELMDVLDGCKKDIAFQLSRWRGAALAEIMEGSTL